MTRKEYTFDAGYQPQVRAPRGTSNIMLDVIIALIPAICVGVWQFGFKALIPVCTSVLSCVFFEWAYRKLLHKHATIGDLSAVVTGLLLAMTLPANAPFWLPIIGAFFAIVFVKQLYGGIGTNFLNPALAGRAFLFASYAMLMTRWTTPNGLKASVDAITMATPLSSMKAGVALPEYFTVADMFIGRMPGCFGEISAAALLLGGIYLICRKVITWHIPVAFIGTVVLHQPHGLQRPPDLRRGLRHPHGRHPPLRRLPGGRQLRDPDHELLRVVPRSAHAAPPVRRLP